MSNDDSLGLPLAAPIAAKSQPTSLKISSSNKGALFIAECEDTERFCKSGAVHCYAPACEWVAGQLALLAGFPVLDPAIVQWKDELMYGCPLIPPGALVRGIRGPNDPRFMQSDNADAICYQAVCFDAWILNPDRHEDNILVVQDQADASKFHAVLSDHDKGMMGHADAFGLDRLQRFTLDPLANWIEHSTAWIREDKEWRNAVTQWSKVQAQAEKITSIPADMLRAVVNQVPEQWIAQECREALEAFLLVRQERLMEIIRHYAARLPNLGGIT